MEREAHPGGCDGERTDNDTGGDEGANAPPTSIASDDAVIDTGATTDLRSNAQTTGIGFQFAHGSYLSDNIAPVADWGISQDAHTVDVVAPGEQNWAVCTPDVTLFSSCVDFKGAPAKVR